jgi:threonine dehydratase
LDELRDAHRRIAEILPPTPQYAWPTLCARTGAEVWVKHENHLPTGAFKVRGGVLHVGEVAAANSAPAGLITATRGNHGQSIAFAGRHFAVPVTVIVPHGNSSEKNAAMRAWGATLIEHGADFDTARAHATALAQAEGLRFVPSFHRDLVLGVATWALELFLAAPPLDTLFVPIGLGSGICGAVLARDLLGLSTEIVGVQSRAAPAYALSFDAGAPVATETANTFADGVAVRIPDPDALVIIRRGVSRIVLVDDDAVAAAIRVYWQDTHNLAEGAGALPLAALLQEHGQHAGRRVGLPLCGGNIDLALFRDWVLRDVP